jgi:hypothetical protein
MRKSFKLMGAIAAAGLIAAGGSAFTAANSVEASNAGAGSTTVTGYSTSDIHFEQDATDPQLLESVTFTLDHEATYVAVRTHAGGTWFTNEDGAAAAGADSCTSDVDGEVWTCLIGHAETIAAATSLSVVATATNA